MLLTFCWDQRAVRLPCANESTAVWNLPKGNGFAPPTRCCSSLPARSRCPLSPIMVAMDWHLFSEGLRKTWQGLGPVLQALVGLSAALGSLYGGWKVLKAGWESVIGRYDRKVLEVLEGRGKIDRFFAGHWRTTMLPVGVIHMAQLVNRKPKRVYKSLRRLERKRKAHEMLGGWHLGPADLSQGRAEPGPRVKSPF